MLAVLGVMFAIGFQVLPRDRITVNQAAERFERDLQRARFNAISFNTQISFELDHEANVYRAVPANVLSAQRAGFVVDLAREGLAGVEINAANSGSWSGTIPCDFGDSDPDNPAAWRFDARGVGRQDGVTLVTFEHARTGYELSLCVNSYGRVMR